MVKNYTFNIKNCIYNVNISNNIAIITDSTGNIICDDIEIADIYVSNKKLIEALVKLNIECNDKKDRSDKLMQEALAFLGLN